MDYNGKVFRPVVNTQNGESSSETVFRYKQSANILTADYAGGQIKMGHLIGLVDEQGNIDMRYHQVNHQGVLMTGICHSRPEVLENGKIRLQSNGNGPLETARRENPSLKKCNPACCDG